ncbi:hypothetical protein N7539_008746 [Penicillium diatomitis]|uniref:Uncharacterized protein n=1 Tax=Penicillium diatomitis TaxID=2819901 RepID=A0A9X0BLV5_9EURO|nr:uncharacterized protein N7539_008746 [Penicillium diatomitis]KAJ5471803.1 hypothetical protein N7539_008746 [Penicillium diatomitis]
MGRSPQNGHQEPNRRSAAMTAPRSRVRNNNRNHGVSAASERTPAGLSHRKTGQAVQWTLSDDKER